MMRFLFYWRFHIAMVLSGLGLITQTIMYFESNTLFWKIIFLLGMLFSLRATYKLGCQVVRLNEFRDRANEELPEGAIVFEEE